MVLTEVVSTSHFNFLHSLAASINLVRADRKWSHHCPNMTRAVPQPAAVCLSFPNGCFAVGNIWDTVVDMLSLADVVAISRVSRRDNKWSRARIRPSTTTRLPADIVDLATLPAVIRRVEGVREKHMDCDMGRAHVTVVEVVVARPGSVSDQNSRYNVVDGIDLDALLHRFPGVRTLTAGAVYRADSLDSQDSPGSPDSPSIDDQLTNVALYADEAHWLTKPRRRPPSVRTFSLMRMSYSTTYLELLKRNVLNQTENRSARPSTGTAPVDVIEDLTLNLFLEPCMHLAPLLCAFTSLVVLRGVITATHNGSQATVLDLALDQTPTLRLVDVVIDFYQPFCQLTTIAAVPDFVTDARIILKAVPGDQSAHPTPPREIRVRSVKGRLE